MKKAAYIVLFLFAFVKGFSQEENPNVPKAGSDSLGNFTVVEEMPEFPGGMEGLVAYLQNSLNYPVQAKEKGIQGKVYTKFIVSETGKIKDVTILRSSGSVLLDNEAKRVVSMMPDWKPGRQSGKAVPVYFNLPVNFRVEKSSSSYSSPPPQTPSNQYYNAGVMESEKGNYEKALENFDKCLAINSKDVDALYNKGAIYLKQKETDKACIEWNKIKAIGKPDADKLIAKYCAQKDSTSEKFAVVEKMPAYPGGMGELMKFLQNNIKNPKGVKSKELVCDKVYVKFVIQADGKVDNIEITKSSGSSLLDEEAKRVVSIMQNWIPGSQNGRNVPVYFNLPIRFSGYDIKC